MQQQEIKCVYHEECHGQGLYQCPACRHWYCEECHNDLFMPIDPMFPVSTAMICANCHYLTPGCD